MILKFRMLSDENDRFLRDYEVPYDMNLLAFHNFVCEDLQFDPSSGMTSFFLSNADWDKLTEFTQIDMGSEESDPHMPIPMERVSLGQIFHQNGDRLIFQFDLINDRALYLELTGTTRPRPNTDYPRIAMMEGSAPDQYDPDATPRERSIFEEAMDDFEGFEGDDNYDDEF